MTVIRSGARALVHPPRTLVTTFRQPIPNGLQPGGAAWSGGPSRPGPFGPGWASRSARERLAGPLPGWASWPGTYKEKKKNKNY